MFKLEYLDDKGGNIPYVSWNGAFSTSNDHIEIEGAFATANGLKDDQLIILQQLRNTSDEPAKHCCHCTVVTPSIDDYELLTRNAELVENLLIHNIRVVSNNLFIPVWILSGSIKIMIKVVKIQPQNSNYALLSNRTELNILGLQESSSTSDTVPSSSDSTSSPLMTSAKQIDTVKNPSIISSVFGIVRSYINDSDAIESPKEREIHSKATSSENLSSDYEIDDRPFRVIPVKDSVLDRRYLCSILVNEKDVVVSSSDGPKADVVLLATITKILSYNECCQPTDSSSERESSKANIGRNDNKKSQLCESYFRSTTVLVVLDNTYQPGTCQVPYNIRRKLGLTISSKINIVAAKRLNLSPATIIDVTPLEGTNSLIKTNQDICSMILSHKQNDLADRFLLASKYTLITLDGTDYLLDGTASHSSTVPYISETSLQDPNNVNLDTLMISRINTSYGLKLPLKTIADMDASLGFQTIGVDVKVDHMSEDVDLFASITTIIKEKLQLIDNCSHRSSPFDHGHILLHGPKKTGKTFLINNISKSLRCSKDSIYTSILQFKQLRGKRIDTFRKTLIKMLAESYYRQPSVIFFDDIDSVVDKDLRNLEEKGPDNMYRKRVIGAFISTLAQLERDNLCFGNRVAIIATCSSLENLDIQVMNPDEKNYFTNLIEITPPDIVRRVKILKNLINNHKNIECQLDDSNLTSISEKCDMFLPQDLKTLLERAMIRAASRDRLDFTTQNSVNLTINDLEQSLKGYIPTRLRGITLQKKSGIKLDQVGGMKNAKDTLIATVLLPMANPILFGKCPIKFQTSVILYGPPGCGKTLIAEAVANEVSMNFLCVRGPELLSKYIGASEAAVRELFEKAEAAKPCIVFFDEFESIAPKRGHDSTGVTDRVVNQLLTMMDGFEELSKGIYIIAATSRPELIDPALLRPGRFDVHVYCGLPDESDRLEILDIICSKIKMDADVDLATWAKDTNYFSGADLKSLVYSAQLVSLNEKIDNTSLEYNTDSRTTSQEERNLVEIVVATRHLVAAINDLRDSIMKNNSMYHIQFPKNFLATQTGIISSRVTLA